MKKVLTFGTKQVVIEQDSDPQNPRTWDNLGQCIFFHKRYNFGDKHDVDADNYDGFEAMEKALYRDFDAAVAIPVYLYDHSGITIKTSSFGCSWDSGQLGFIIATRETIKKEFGFNKRISAKLKAKVTALLEGEIETLDNYLTGDVYGFEVHDIITPATEDQEAETEETSSCWGFYGDNAENGMFDYIGAELGVTFEEYKEVYKQADWVYEDSYC